MNMEENEYQYRFVSETTPNREMMKEAYWGNFLRSWRLAAYAVVALLNLGLAGKYIYEAWYWSSQGWPEAWMDYVRDIAVFSALGLILVIVLLTAPALSARRYMKQLETVYGNGAIPTVFRFYADDGMHLETSTGEKTMTAYDQILSVVETEHCILLRRKMSMFEVLEKDRIHGGTLDEFKAYLEEKMPNVRFHWKHRA